MKNIKTTAAIVILTFLLFSFSNCGGAQNSETKMALVQNPPFKIAEAYTQNWVAGVKEGGSGTNVHLLFSNMDTGVTIQNIYFRNQILDAKNNKNEPNKYVGYLKNKMQSDVVMDADPMKEAKNTPSKPFPFQLSENEAVIEYLENGKKNYYKISNLLQKEMITYPGANPHE